MIVKTVDVSRRFGSFQALKHVDLEIEDGEFVAILGPSGCGKTTLLRLLAGFDAPTAGMVEMDGKVVADSEGTVPPEKRNIGMVFQSFALWPHMNVREHLLFSLRHHRFVPEALKKNAGDRAQEVLRIVKLTDFADRLPGELSGGQKQRVALGRAIAAEPGLLLMDEPLSSLDAELRMEMRGEIQDIHRMTGASIVYVTHDQSEALAMADRIVVMNQGMIEQVGSPQEIYNRPKTEFVARFVGKANLVTGKWMAESFVPDVDASLRWDDLGVTAELKRRNVYPVRPEQLTFGNDRTGVPGTIANVQFQGKEIHYDVRIRAGLWHVHTGVRIRHKVGDTVFIRPKEKENL